MSVTAEPIMSTWRAVEQLLETAGVRIVLFSPNERDDSAQCYWTGADSLGRVTFDIDVMPQDWRTVGDLFVRVWNTLADSDFCSPITFSVNYGTIPLGHKEPTSWVKISAASTTLIDVRGI